MKPVFYNDVLAAVSFVAAGSEADRHVRCQTLLSEADQADRFIELHGAAHPAFGDGTLAAAALRHQAHGDISFESNAGLCAWLCVLTALKDRLDQPDAQLMQRVAVGSNSNRLKAISSPQSSHQPKSSDASL